MSETATDKELLLVPESDKPKVKTTYLAGALAALAGMAWNHWMPELNIGEAGVASLAVVIGGLAGPLYRRFQKWAEQDKMADSQVEGLARKIADIDSRLMRLEGKPTEETP